MKNRRVPSAARRPQALPRRSGGGSTSSIRISLGIHAVREALKVRPKEVRKLLVRSNWQSSTDLQELVEKARHHKVSVEERTAENLDRVGSHNQGVVCEIEGRPQLSVSDLGASERSVVVVLDGVEDPHNLGAILRTCWLMGVEAVILPSDRAVSLVPTVHKVSCGGVEHVPVIEVPNLANALTSLKQAGFWVFGLAAEGSNKLSALKLPPKIIWAFGAEDKGLRVTTERVCDELVSIPQQDNAASYNVSVAAAITLYETARQFANEKV